MGSQGYQWKYNSFLASKVAIKVAESAEEAYPRASIDLYQQEIEHLITGRGRSNYQVACNYLLAMRAAP